MDEQPMVYVVDDDQDARDSVCALVEAMGVRTWAFPSAEKFLASYDRKSPGCLVTDLHMVGMSGLELQEQLAREGCRLPVIVISGHVNIDHAVRAMRTGAETVLQKPYQDQDLWDAIGASIARHAKTRLDHAHQEEIRDRLASLQPAEQEVLELIVAGKPNKAVAKRLGISQRTVEDRRHRIMRKLRADSFASLMRMVIAAKEVEQKRED